MLKLQLGMPNDDYPAVMKRKAFIIDIDAFNHALMSYQEVTQLMTVLNTACNSAL